MIKRTTGRLLLTLLVATGLAGTINVTSLTKAERKQAVTQFKESRARLQQNIKGLSATQLTYKASPDRWSVQECVYHIALSEKNLWAMFEEAMKKEPAPDKRAEVKISDEELLKSMTDRSQKRTAMEILQPSKATWSSASEAFDAFKQSRAAHLKYTKNTTEDLRNHFIQLPFGWIDAYQFLLLMAGHSTRHTLQIEEILQSPGFPQK